MYRKNFPICCFYLLFLNINVFAVEQLNICTWYDYIPIEVIERFEKETGTQVNVDFFDSDNILETKLFAGNSGYDLVITATWPFLVRQIKLNVFQSIDKTKLLNYKNINPLLLSKINNADNKNQHIIPYFWGLIALGYNKKIIGESVSSEHLKSWNLIYDLNILPNIANKGIVLFNDSITVFITYCLYKNIDFKKISLEEISKIFNSLANVADYIKKIDSALIVDKLMNRELSLVMSWNETLINAQRMHAKFKNTPDIEIILPKEGTLMWIDCIAIPKMAKNTNNAYKFIDFLLRTDIATYITNHNVTATSVMTSYKFLKKSIRNNKILFPSKEYLEKSVLPEIESIKILRAINRHYTKIMTSH